MLERELVLRGGANSAAFLACGSVALSIKVVIFAGYAGKNHHKREKYRSAAGKKSRYAGRPQGDRVTRII